ncbi:GNAT family N-acetyltransferase [Frigoribacterium sp. CFBP 8754]|uniref:GNAT family N-acetyltransferase n=1 Tax=Frigoribacterium sp. CFBP 8754 TaxID=2775290 RepID=UPI0017856213|nr:GNAT family N-acetyltransferase [Frigoribacterium sp. CFBP 8754]MBD8661219.1 GNAT family N-acetyltransferase [Frigoribacterium sp. CFBP 8754]
MTTPEGPPAARQHAVAVGPLGLRAVDALVTGDLALASVAIGVDLPAAFLDDGWLWAIRLEQILADERDEPWVAWVATRDGQVVGHTGFHGRPDADGEVEVSYTVLPELRGRGVGAQVLEAVLAFCDAAPAVRSVRASVSPDNAPSLALARSHGFVLVGEQVDEVDGLELVLRREPQRAS